MWKKKHHVKALLENEDVKDMVLSVCFCDLCLRVGNIAHVGPPQPVPMTACQGLTCLKEGQRLLGDAHELTLHTRTLTPIHLSKDSNGGQKAGAVFLQQAVCCSNPSLAPRPLPDSFLGARAGGRRIGLTLEEPVLSGVAVSWAPLPAEPVSETVLLVHLAACFWPSDVERGNLETQHVQAAVQPGAWRRMLFLQRLWGPGLQSEPSTGYKQAV